MERAVKVVTQNIYSLVLGFAQSPADYPELIDLQTPLPGGLEELLKFAVDMENASGKSGGSRIAGVSPVAFNSALAFFLDKVLFVAGGDYYRALGLNSNASHEQIRRYYRLLINLFYQDKGHWNEANFVKINLSYNTLNNPIKKHQYDAKLEMHRRRKATPQIVEADTQKTKNKSMDTGENRSIDKKDKPLITAQELATVDVAVTRQLRQPKQLTQTRQTSARHLVRFSHLFTAGRIGAIALILAAGFFYLSRNETVLDVTTIVERGLVPYQQKDYSSQVQHLAPIGDPAVNVDKKQAGASPAQAETKISKNVPKNEHRTRIPAHPSPLPDKEFSRKPVTLADDTKEYVADVDQVPSLAFLIPGQAATRTPRTETIRTETMGAETMGNKISGDLAIGSGTDITTNKSVPTQVRSIATIELIKTWTEEKTRELGGIRSENTPEMETRSTMPPKVRQPDLEGNNTMAMTAIDDIRASTSNAEASMKAPAAINIDNDESAIELAAIDNIKVDTLDAGSSLIDPAASNIDVDEPAVETVAVMLPIITGSNPATPTTETDRIIGAADDVVVIVNDSNTQSLTSADIKNIYSDNVIAWDDGKVIDIYNLPAGSSTRASFSEKILGLSTREATAAENNRRITNVIRNQPRTSRERLVVVLVARKPEAIGYVSRAAIQGRTGIRVIMTLE